MNPGGPNWPRAAPADASAQYVRVRQATEALCSPLRAEDYVPQSMPDASPVKWHLAHTTWFFERFVLGYAEPSYRPYSREFDYLFNSYYESLGKRQLRSERGLLTRPTVPETFLYRSAIDEQMAMLLRRNDPRLWKRVELGLAHEEQHQELILTDLLHLFSKNALLPTYKSASLPNAPTRKTGRWEHPGGILEVGSDGRSFCFDNECPRHRVFLEAFAISKSLVTNREYQAFVADKGYERPELWLSDGFTLVQREHWKAPLYWAFDAESRTPATTRYSLHGPIDIDPDAPVSHISFYEADAFARWAGARLPTEAEWETIATTLPRDGQFVEHGLLVPVGWPRETCYGGAWQWTQSAYMPYPGYASAPGPLGEYNGKFMCNQLVLRGGSCFSPREHLRACYRNFFYPNARWQVTGIRLAYNH